MFTHRGVRIEALGQSWFFTPIAIEALMLTEREALELLKIIVVEHGTAKGYREGIFDVETGELVLRFAVSGTEITVDLKEEG